VAATGTGHSTPAALPERRPERRPFTAQASSIHSTPAALPECRSECRPERRPFESAGDAGLWPLINEGLASVRAPFGSLRPLQGGAQGSASAAPSAAPLRSPAVTPATGTRGTRVADEGGHQRCHQAPSWASSSETRGTRGLSNGGGSSGGGGGIGTRGGGGGRYPCSCGNGSCGRRRAAADVTNAKAHHVSHGSACGGGTSLLRMAEWHRLMRLQPGAPLYEGASSSMQVLLTAPLPFHRCASLRGRVVQHASAPHGAPPFPQVRLSSTRARRPACKCSSRRPSLSTGAPVLYEGARGIVRRANPIRETYAVHLLDEQRTVDVPYGSDALWADIGEPALCSSAGHASAKSTSGTCSSGGSASRGACSVLACSVPANNDNTASDCFSSVKLMHMV